MDFYDNHSEKRVPRPDAEPQPVPAPPGTLSPDGFYTWDGTTWKPTPPPTPAPSTTFPVGPSPQPAAMVPTAAAAPSDWQSWAEKSFPQGSVDLWTYGAAVASKTVTDGATSDVAAARALDAMRLQAASPSRRWGRTQPLWHVVVLFIATVSLYYVYWTFRNWRDLRRVFGFGYQPLVWTVLLVVATAASNTAGTASKAAPVGLAFVVWRLMLGQFRNIEKVASRDAGDKSDSAFLWAALFAAPVIVNAIPGIPDYELIFIALAATTGTLAAMLVMQRKLNRIWHALEPDLPTRNGFSVKEIVVLVVFPAIWILAIVVLVLNYQATP